MSKVRVGILGCGGFAGAHARRYKANPDVQVVALCDTDPSHMDSLIERRLAEVSPPPACYSDPQTMYAEANLDAVSILTPHTLHFQHATQALQAGCHVLVEKPMVTRTADAEQLAQTVRETGKLLLVGYNTAYAPPVIWLRDAIAAGQFGKLEMVNAYLCQDWKRLTAGTWRHDPSLSGGGQAFDSGAHLLNTLCWCLQSEPVEVFARTDRLGTPVDINTALLATFANGVMATVAIGGNCPTNGSHASFLFDGGRVDVDGWTGQWVRAFTAEGEQTGLPEGDEDASANANFIDAILGRAEPLCTVDNGLIQCKLMDALYASAESGKPVRLS